MHFTFSATSGPVRRRIHPCAIAGCAMVSLLALGGAMAAPDAGSATPGEPKVAAQEGKAGAGKEQRMKGALAQQAARHEREVAEWRVLQELSQKRLVELEAKARESEAKVKERDAMIAGLEKAVAALSERLLEERR